jgi:hypothetical protein
VQAWLHGEPQTPTFAQFWSDLVALLSRETFFETLDDQSQFRVTLDLEERRIMLTAADKKALLLSESTTADLWHAIRTAGYCAPQNLPAGLDARASMIVALLTKLDYIRPVKISHPESQTVIGLHVVSILNETSRASTMKVLDA